MPIAYRAGSINRLELSEAVVQACRGIALPFTLLVKCGFSAPFFLQNL